MTSKIGTKDNAHAALRTQWRLIQFILRSYLQSLLLVTLGDVHDLEGWGQALLKLVGLVGVLQDQRVEEAVASDLELDLLGLAVALNAGGGGILAPGNFNELLNVGDLARHDGQDWRL